MSTTIVKDELQRIYDERGDLTPHLLLDAATDPSHPLHDRFEWDDTKAGQCWRLDQAAHLIRSVRVTFKQSDEATTDLRAFVAVRGKDKHQASYTPIEKALADPFTRELVLRDMQREWKALKKRYEHMSEFASMVRTDLSA